MDAVKRCSTELRRTVVSCVLGAWQDIGACLVCVRNCQQQLDHIDRPQQALVWWLSSQLNRLQFVKLSSC